MLRTAPIRSERDPDDGLRVSVMSRHTFDGDPVNLDPSIRSDLFDLHLPELAPEGKRVGEWYRGDKDEAAWDKFQLAYKERIEMDPRAWLAMARISELATNGNVTLLCSEPEPHHCHRRLLAEDMKVRFPGLRLLIG